MQEVIEGYRMARILSLFQIKTTRSAWVFLIGSGLMFLFGVYQFLMDTSLSPKNPGFEFLLVFFAVWLSITGSYMGIASWALWSKRGQMYLSQEEPKPIKGNRTVLWFLKFLFACYAAAFATLMLVGVLALPFAGFKGFESVFFSEHILLYILAIGAVYAPLVYRYLK